MESSDDDEETNTPTILDNCPGLCMLIQSADPERPIAKYTKGFKVWPVRCGLSVGFAPVSS